MLTYDCWVAFLVDLWPRFWWALLIQLWVLLHKHGSRISFPFTYLFTHSAVQCQVLQSARRLGQRPFSTAKWMNKLFCETSFETNWMSRKLKLRKPSKVVGWSWKWSCPYSWVDDANGSLSQAGWWHGSGWSLTRAEEVWVYPLHGGQLFPQVSLSAPFGLGLEILASFATLECHRLQYWLLLYFQRSWGSQEVHASCWRSGVQQLAGKNFLSRTSLAEVPAQPCLAWFYW